MTVEFHDFTPTRDPIEDEMMALRIEITALREAIEKQTELNRLLWGMKS